ncbi:M96 mating-specific protein family [Phytophthora palmivora]|uniref:M96 mating-specific protein family n=1 Tax=Phytophthora palmivora TaxID=4796 RepID=A0A2P4XIF3_9STRA|nr:M96 mating-specific protein family [Phytophthora palmivora]
MVFQLLDEDEQTFTEILALLDEYNAAFEEPTPVLATFKHSSPFSRVTESAAWTAFETAHPITENANKHRNGAREMRRREVQFLQTFAIECAERGCGTTSTDENYHRRNGRIDRVDEYVEGLGSTPIRSEVSDREGELFS